MLDIVPSLYTAPPKTSAYFEPEDVDFITAFVTLSLYNTLSNDGIIVPSGLLITAPPIYCE